MGWTKIVVRSTNWIFIDRNESHEGIQNKMLGDIWATCLFCMKEWEKTGSMLSNKTIIGFVHLLKIRATQNKGPSSLLGWGYAQNFETQVRNIRPWDTFPIHIFKVHRPQWFGTLSNGPPHPITCLSSGNLMPCSLLMKGLCIKSNHAKALFFFFFPISQINFSKKRKKMWGLSSTLNTKKVNK